ncbi:uncharacterized protein LOC100874698 isoform X2 [Megachile rotundata]|uniref:uncharacterized protein LOC100874698 isoform X2 n=1 Tax=Megachile rotundata TaxID=143995 RepID=UPI003FD319FF
MESGAPLSSLDELVRQVLLKIGESVASCSATSGNSTAPTQTGVIPEFSGSDIGEDANSWCKVVEEITKACSTQVRLNLATHALRGPAKSWYHDWKGQPRTWEKFSKDLCSVFVTRKNLHERLSRAVAYNSDSAKTYAEYARTKLFYLEQTRVAFQTEELIELIIGAVTDQTIRQSLLNGQYKTTAELIVGLTQFVKPTTEKEASEDRRKEQADKQQRGKKRCYSCDEVGHIQVNCQKKRKLEQKEKPGKRLTCTFCSKKGHEESNCWAKQRAPSQPGRKRAEANICSLADCKTTPVLIQGVLVPSLLDTGADCSLIKESVARKANCKVMPSATIVRGLGNVSVTTLGRTTVILQAEDASVELDFLVVADEDLAYDAIVGRNVLEGGNLRLVTSAEGTRLQRVDETSSPEKRTVGQCYVVGSGNSDERSVLESLIGKYQHMIAPTDSSRCVTTGEMKINTKSDQVPSFNGSSYLRYPGLADTSLSWLELAVTLKPTAPDGVILYNGHHSDATGDFIALYLSSGHVQFTFDLGTGPATLRSENPVRLGEWVEVRVSRTGRLASLEVEDDPPQEILAPGAFTQLSLPLNLYLGGAPSTDMYSPKMKTTASFVGCIQTVILNRREIGILAEALGGVNVGNCGHACEARPCGDAECRPLRDRFTCRCRPGMPHPCPAPDDNTILNESLTKPNVGTRYERSVPSFSGSESYLHYNDADTMKRIISYRVDINMRFRASSSSGLLLWSGRQADPQEQRDENDDFLALGLDHGYLTLAYNLGSGQAVLRYNLTRLDDDLWHRVRAVRNEQWASLVVDSGTGVSASSPGQLRQLNTDTGLYVGGAPDIVRTTGGRYTKGIVGCISDLVLDSDFSVALSSPGQATNTHSCIP